MRGILWGKFKLLLRKPGPFIATTIICIVFAFLTGTSSQSKIEIPAYSTLPEKEINEILKDLNKSESFSFVIKDEKTVKNAVAEGKIDAGLQLEKNKFTIFHVNYTQNFYLINQYVGQYYEQAFQNQQILDAANHSKEAERILKNINKNPIFELSTSSYKNESDWVYNPGLQSLFGFTLFFAVYTVAYNVVEILKEKQSGVWDRYILSPTSKISMYIGNLLYSFISGYIQIVLIFVVFKFGAGVDFYGSFYKTLILIIPYLFAIVALSILLTSLVKTMGQFNALIPLIGVSFAMLGGAYWPIEVVTSDILITISKFVPITYGMEMLKGATISGLSFQELLYPISILILMGVVMMGIGIRLMENRHV
ncbi:ABC transporter permease [Bacillus sp. 31A1R]|uniref:ABC transporter permease n=1 Tax=Robertmurraya mangrovi TaxID=3098077 RepID=A0ABU5IT38_9BACI|nr:ABC transporter permease [Bacillus sp. 31A1R]MDZ5470286.1 ABC transporter permease [Bacillus sp. 31A1R]